MSATHGWFIAVGAALALAAPLSAQQSPLTSAAPASVATTAQMAAPAYAHSLAPTMESVALNMGYAPIAAPFATSTMALLPVQQANRRGSVALMAVGGAMLVVGSLISGDTGTIVMVGGGAIGLLGLYRYLR